jgi:hypothetical protein
VREPRTRRLLVGILLAAAALAHAAAGAGRPNAASPLGTNLDAVADWSQEWVFVDAFRASRGWISGSAGEWSDRRSLDTDADGWVRSLQPGQVARTLLLWDLQGRYPGGTYIVLYEGQGTLQYGVAAILDAARSRPGRDVLRVEPAKGGIAIVIAATATGDPIRNIRVIMPGGTCAGDPYRHAADAAGCAGAGAFKSFEKHHAELLFHPKFLERIRGYRGLRFLNWGATNGSKQSAWAGRARLSDARWSTEKGVPIEVMVELANRVGADAWFTLPHLADDAYVRDYARLVKRLLRADLKAYIEYSNEVWNGQFPQAHHARREGLAQRLSRDPLEAQLRFYSKRSLEVFDIWSAEFADPARLVRVMASQAGNAWASEQVLDFRNAKQKTDALAIAPYFGGGMGVPAERARVEAMSLDELFSVLEHTALPAAVGWMQSQAAVARARRLPLIAYEGGQHLTGVLGVENSAAVNALFDAANRDPRIGVLYAKYLEAWKRSGGTILFHLSNCGGYSKWGRWGALEYLEQPRSQAPKFDALQSFIERNQAWW